jgi:hypothetical protein
MAALDWAAESGGVLGTSDAAPRQRRRRPATAGSTCSKKPAGEWNRMQVRVKGTKVTVLLNGEVVNEVSLDQGALKSRPLTGYIGFQDHGLPLWLRNIRVRDLK